MRNSWSGLGLLLIVPWLANCVTRPEIRLDTGQGSPIVYTPPVSEPPPVEIRQEEFIEALTDIVLHMPLTLSLPKREGRVVLASWERPQDTAQDMLRSQCAPLESPDGCLVLPKNAPPPETLARMRLALSFAMDSVWEGAAVPISEILDPLAFKVMVYTAISTSILLLMMPDPVTKGLAAVLTLYLVAYLGLGPVWSMVKAGWELLHDCERATTTKELKQAGHRFGLVLGDSGMRVFLLLATTAIGGKTSFVGKGPRLPGFRQAALASPTRTGVKLEAAGQVKTVVLGAKALVVGLAPTAVAATAIGLGGGDSPGTKGRPTEEPSQGKGSTHAPSADGEPLNTGRWHGGSYGSPLKSLQDHFARHGVEVGATDVAQYLRKAEAFSQNLRGAQKFPIEGFTEGVVRYVKNGRYIDLAPDGRIVSFGAR